MNLSAKTDFPSLCAQYISMLFFYSHDFIDLLSDSQPLCTHILFGFAIRLV